MPFKDKEKQKEAQRDWVRQKRLAEQGSTAIIDATGKSHKMDFESRRKDYELLKSWVDGEGTPHQQALGELAVKYSVVTGYLDKDYNLTTQGRRYLALPTA